jgi:hypothetical protein
LAINVSLTSEDILVFQRIYSEKPEAVEWMYRFGPAVDKITSGLIIIANEGKTGVWSLSADNTWRPGIYP